MKSQPNVCLCAVLLLCLSPVFWPSVVAATDQVCDVNLDGTIDRTDITAIVAARNTPANGPTDPRDADHDGLITVKDAKVCALQCSRPNCQAGQMLTSGAEPVFDPGIWNFDGVTPDLATAQSDNNCYNYACNKRTDTFAQPGRAAGQEATALTCEDVTKASVADGLVPASCSKACPAASYKKALVVDPGNDYHWYRQDRDGTWSHKPGSTRATNLDGRGKPIVDPRVADRDGNGLHYTDFCGCFCCGAGVVKN